MPLISLLVTLVIVGVVLWLVETYIPIACGPTRGRGVS
jgi:hypothetical protein